MAAAKFGVQPVPKPTPTKGPVERAEAGAAIGGRRSLVMPKQGPAAGAAAGAVPGPAGGAQVGGAAAWRAGLQSESAQDAQQQDPIPDTGDDQQMIDAVENAQVEAEAEQADTGSRSKWAERKAKAVAFIKEKGVVALSGAYEGGKEGLSVGMAAGPKGAAIGAAAGAVAGGYNAVTESNDLSPAEMARKRLDQKMAAHGFDDSSAPPPAASIEKE